MTSFVFTWDGVFNAATAAIVAVFAAWILTLRPRTGTSIALGLGFMAYGLHYVLLNLTPLEVDLVVALAAGVLGLVMAGAFIVLAWTILREHGRPRLFVGGLVWLALLFAVGVWAAVVDLGGFGVDLAGTRGAGNATGPEKASVAFASVVFPVWTGAFALLPLQLGLAARHADGAGFRRLHRLAFACTVWTAVYVGGLLSNLARPSVISSLSPLGTAVSLLSMAPVAIAAFVWLSIGWRGGPDGGVGRNLGLLLLSLMAFELLDSLYLREPLGYSDVANGPFYGLARLATVVLLGRAILRDQILGFDVGLRFGISKGTVAAIVVAVVFVVSEGAQTLFDGDTQWLGLAVGGLVVFAIAPIQRAADRLAEKAVPSTTGVTAIEAAYLAGLRAAARDGRLTRREERHLADMAEHLKIGPKRALELREGMETEVKP